MNSLVVESSPKIRDSLCYMLLSLGIKGIPCGNKDQALEAVSNLNEDVFSAIIDIDNKEAEGVELIKELKQNPKTIDIKIIVHTIQSNKEAVIKMLEMGIIGYLLKPYNETETYDKLNKIFNRLEGQEKRQHIRITPDPEDLLRVHFRITGYPHLISGKIVNLSMGGMALELFSPVEHELLTADTQISSINFTLGSKQISPPGVAVMRKDKYLALKFNAMSQNHNMILAKYIFKRIGV
ncbi:MAG: response regulator [Spirochaetales bacterium]|nr:response regulator [Spirochaetales bacterium]